MKDVSEKGKGFIPLAVGLIGMIILFIIIAMTGFLRGFAIGFFG